MLVKQPETIKLVKDIQHLIKEHPRKGFWAVGGAAFFLSPFLTNDGVCLLFVAPVMSAFTSLDDSTIMDPSDPNLITIDTIKLKSTDALFFCLNIACSSNIGSALTYIGNPQNMIVAQDAIGVMPPYMFLGYMLIPSVFAFFATSLYLERCWVLSRREDAIKAQDTLGGAFEGTEEAESPLMKQLAKDQGLNGPVEDAERIFTPMSPKKRSSRTGSAGAGIEQGGLGDADADEAPQNRFHYSEYWLQGPFPYSIVALTVVMIICIFFEVMSIAGIIGITLPNLSLNLNPNPNPNPNSPVSCFHVPNLYPHPNLHPNPVPVPHPHPHRIPIPNPNSNPNPYSSRICSAHVYFCSVHQLLAQFASARGHTGRTAARATHPRAEGDLYSNPRL